MRASTGSPNVRYHHLKIIAAQELAGFLCGEIGRDRSYRPTASNRQQEAQKRSSVLKNVCSTRRSRRWSQDLQWVGSSCGLAGGRSAAACAGFSGPLLTKASRRFTFWPAAVIRASALTFLSVLVRKRPIPCQSLPSANKGSIHTLRFLRGLHQQRYSLPPLPQPKNRAQLRIEHPHEDGSHGSLAGDSPGSRSRAWTLRRVVDAV